MMAVSNVIRLILLCCLILVATPLFISKGDAIPASSERTYPIQEEGAHAMRSRKTGETYIITVVDVSPEEARRLHFPGWDEPDKEIVPFADDLHSRITAAFKTTLTKRDYTRNDHPGHANATCGLTGQTLLYPIELQSAVNHEFRRMKFTRSSIHINIRVP